MSATGYCREAPLSAQQSPLAIFPLIRQRPCRAIGNGRWASGMGSDIARRQLRASQGYKYRTRQLNRQQTEQLGGLLQFHWHTSVSEVSMALHQQQGPASTSRRSFKYLLPCVSGRPPVLPSKPCRFFPPRPSRCKYNCLKKKERKKRKKKERKKA